MCDNKQLFFVHFRLLTVFSEHFFGTRASSRDNSRGMFYHGNIDQAGMKYSPENETGQNRCNPYEFTYVVGPLITH